MFPLVEGLAGAVEVRVAYHMGHARPERAKSCAWKTVLLGFEIAVFSTALLYIIAENIPSWLTPDPTQQKMIYETLPLLGVGQISMNSGIMCWSVIGAQGRYRLATIIEMAASWIIVIPMSAILIYIFNFNLLGPVSAVVVGYSVSGAANAFVVLRSDWQKLSEIVIERMEEEEDDSSSSSSSSSSASAASSASSKASSKGSSSNGSDKDKDADNGSRSSSPVHGSDKKENDQKEDAVGKER